VTIARIDTEAPFANGGGLFIYTAPPKDGVSKYRLLASRGVREACGGRGDGRGVGAVPSTPWARPLHLPPQPSSIASISRNKPWSAAMRASGLSCNIS